MGQRASAEATIEPTASGAGTLEVGGAGVAGADRSPLVWTRPFQAAYERTRWPIVPIVGLGPMPWPVKLHTWIGSPIPFVPHRTPEALRAETRAAIEALIAAHQPGRPRILRGLAARLREASAPKREEPDQRR